MSQYQENYSDKNKLIYDSSNMVSMRFPVVNTALLHEKGQLVTLTATGAVQPAVAADVVLGWVSVANIVADPSGPVHHADYVTVRTICADGNYGYAKGGALAIGDLVVADGQSAIDAKFTDYIIAATGQYAVGIVISGAAAGSEVTVLLFNSPLYKA